jgi:hypothetical protein
VEKRNKRNERVFSKKVKAGKRRTYFFDVQKTKGNDYYVTLTESTRNFNDDGFIRHKIFLYKEDFNRFLEGLEETINHIKDNLMPDYDYEEFDRRHEENEDNDEFYNKEEKKEETEGKKGKDNIDENISW